MKTTLRQRLLTSTLLLGCAGIAAPAYAQDTDSNPPVSAETQDVEADGAIVVTGSRITRRDLTSSSPVAVVGDEEFTLSGSVNVEQVINTLPQVVPGATSFSNNPGGGVATLNLRGLGSQRNLVLVNGRRYIFFDTSQVVDINTIPAFLIGSVDVVTGGASAVYGSDALAGVINFRMRDDLDGIIAGAQYNITGDGDGRRYNAYVAMGSDFADNRGNISVFAEYAKRGSIGQGDRDFSRFALSDGATGLVPGGSAGVPQGRIVAVGSAAAPTATVAAGTNYVGGGAFFFTPGTSRPYSGATDSYNYAPANFLMVPQERWTLGGFGEYEIADSVTAFAEVNFINNRVENELAATPLTQNVDFNVAQLCGRLSASDCTQITTIAGRQQAAQAASTGGNSAFPAFTAGTGQFGALAPGNVRLQVNSRFVQIANRNASDDRNAFRVLAGLKGDITDSLTYEAYYMYSRTRNSQIQEGNVSRSAFTRLAANGTCNPFGENQYSEACISGVSILAQNTDISELQVAQASISGPLFQFGSASSPVAFAAGVEWRSMGGQFIPDTALQSGDVVGFNAGQSTEGRYDAKEVFGEILVPLIEDGFIHRLELNGAGRYSDYSLDAVGGVYSYAGGARFAPIRDIEFRGQYQRAVRAPNVSELFGGQSIGFPPATDPCALASAATNSAIRAVCEATGVPSGSVGQAFLQPNTQIQGAFGGNPNLQEEVADTFTAGVVLRPSFIPRLNITLDYYDIEIKNAIATAGGGVNGILNLCYNVIQDATGPVCNLVSRDTQGIISGPPFVVSAGNANLASLATSGYDFQVDYDMPLGFSAWGQDESRLNFFFLLNYSDENDFVPVVGVDDTVECAGRFGLNCGNPTPKWKWSSRLSWLDGPVTTSVRWRHIGAVTDDDEATDFIVDRIEAVDYFDLTVGFNAADNFTLNLGVNNIFDKQPPIIGSNQEQANTYPGVYDVLGRDFFVSVQLRF
ncbi:TonB-dependent receptor domain-containing protein [Tsuneonella troitsensis]|uniref:TonB-dependent receptor domain-containing protein n=1 Tax=Tsuneonella troitsensis TaxID=292222 RepID=UPI000F460D05|nr:TonB-dependent receptor [Tsuneonella troitsensis]